MPVPTIPSAISASSIQTEFDGSNPISLSEYYSGSGLVPSGTANATSVLIPSSGNPLRFSNFSGAQKIASSTAAFTVGFSNLGSAFATMYGYNFVFSPSFPIGSMSPTATIGSRTVVRLYDSYVFGGHQAVVFSVNGNQTGSWWNTIQWTHGTTGYSVTVNRSAANPSEQLGVYESSPNITSWYLFGTTLLMKNASTITPAGESGTIVITA
jgi:hypothetical protein